MCNFHEIVIPRRTEILIGKEIAFCFNFFKELLDTAAVIYNFDVSQFINDILMKSVVDVVIKLNERLKRTLFMMFFLI